ncbi:MAG: benzoyl-CoA reductase, bzd-type, subunit N [Dehalococcoidales bacterium]|nr:benzoyl-CoA reductase, bzd-type, subunit N [Dehalococcoidales bacterium]
MEASEILKQFNDIWQLRHEYAKDWKQKNGGKVVGCMCTYYPEEVMYAAGMLPVRILGGHEATSQAAPHMFDMWCPFSRDCLNQALKGKYDYLDGVMEVNTCLHMRVAYGAWTANVPTPWSYYFVMPNAVRSPHAKTFLRGELVEFKKALEEWTGKTISEEDLDRGIDIVDTNRRLMKQVYEFRKEDNPPITGTEAMTIVWASQLMDKREQNEMLKQLLETLPERKLDRETGVRLMIVGSEDDDREFLNMVETELGATFVIEDHCTGTRYFWDEITPQKDRLQAIADRYCDRTPCPSKDWGMEDGSRVRFDKILEFAKEYRVQGAILTQQKFCDPHELDIPSLRRVLENNGIPCYFLEFEVTVPLGPFKIRVEAFIEQLLAEELFA